ncbi:MULTISPECIES: DUF1648 domain-containing protein [unclassified Adlercreutzia]|uniref:DUF1648 domain-containing protein n=1 Tax=unclassified Adlercreutzia TaxID=2636013 RepID=UPI0013EA663F|nr:MULTISPECIES: DUF5808 domain-containing protein [unclassified Adlercreutzia]
MEILFPLALLVLTVPLTGGLMAATPYLMPKRECFAVTVPESAHADPQIKALKSRYARTVAVMTAAFTLLAALATVPLARASYSEAAANALIGAIALLALIPVAVSFALMLRNRRRVMAIKRERGWHAPRQQAAALVAEGDVPGPVSLAWNLLYLPVVLFVAALGAMWYPLMPDMIPMHVDFAGNVNDYSPKSLWSVSFPLVVIAFVGATFALCHWSMTRSKRPTNPGAPMTSALAYGLFARAQSVLLLACGLLLSLTLGVAFMASSAGFITLNEAAAVICLACVPAVAGSLILAVVYGQNGSRLFKRMEAAGAAGAGAAAAGAASGGAAAVGASGGAAGAGASEDAADASASGDAAPAADAPAAVSAGSGSSAADATLMPFDDDAHWKLGIFYFNPDDASLWLPERFGIGWTMNFARPAAWAFVGGFTLLTIVFVALCFAIT